MVELMNDLLVKYEEMIGNFMIEIFKKLGGDGINVQIKSLFIGDGLFIRGILGYKNQGFILFLYDYMLVDGKIKMKMVKRYVFNLGEVFDLSLYCIVYFDVFVVDGVDGFVVLVKVYRNEI